MDLIANLTLQFGLEPDKAKGLAGAVLGQIEQGVGQSLGGAEASAFRTQLPELDDWKAKVSSLAGGASGDGGGAGGLLGALGGGGLGAASGLGGGLLGAAGSLLGGSGSGFDVGSLIALAGKAGIGGAAVQQLVPLVLSFLQSRLDPALLSKIMAAVPGLQQFAGGTSPAGAGGLAGALGGLFGR